MLTILVWSRTAFRVPAVCGGYPRDTSTRRDEIGSGPRTELRLPAEPIAPALARAGVRGAAPELSERVAADLALLLTEVVSNAVRHASKDPGDEIVIRLFANAVVRVEVQDAGPGFEPVARLRPDEGDTSGWGLYLLERIASAWGVERGPAGTMVWFELLPTPS